MSKKLQYSALAAAALVVIALVASALAVTSAKAATSYYVDCSAGSNGNGSQASPWNTLTSVNAPTFVAGDQILFKRGTMCAGQLYPKGSGASGSPITVDAYGTGALPIINGSGQTAAVKLNNSSYFVIKNLEIKNSTRYGLYATGTANVTNLTLQNLVVHDVTGGTMDSKETGLILVEPGVKGTKYNNVMIDGVTAYNTTLWSGIMVYGIYLTGDMQWDTHAKDITRRSTNIVIQNSTVHNTYGDGIVTYLGNGVTMQNNVAYLSGQQASQTIGTPNGIWTWASNNVLVQGNEAYDNNSPGADGGGYDIDYWSADSIYQYNYGHHNSAYCVGVFGAENAANTNNIVRYNICANNGYENNVSTGGPEEIYFCTWSGGSLSNVQVYNNTIYTTVAGAVGTCPGIPNPTFVSGQPITWRNNLVVSTVANVVGTGMSHIPWTSRDYNLYYYTGGSYTGTEAHSIYNQNPQVNGFGYSGIGMPTTQWTLQSGSPAINAGVDPCTGITGCAAGTRDFFGNAIPNGAYDIGAYESGGAPQPTNTPANTPTPTSTPGGPTPTSTNTTVPPTPTNTLVPPTPTVTNTPGGTVMHVHDLYTTDASGNPKTVFIAGTDTVYWRVKIVDASGNPVSGAAVTTQVLKPNGSQWVAPTATTGADGWALFSKSNPNNSAKGVYTINVTNVTKSGWTYDSNANLKTSTTFTIQ